MLKSPPFSSPELLKVLCEMEYGDRIWGTFPVLR